MYKLLFLAACFIGSTLAAQTPSAYPCQSDPNMQKLDFWLGEWEVYVADTLAAYSSITKSLGGCTLHEDYRTVSGYTGRSMNYFDPADSLYKQVWIDHTNAISHYTEVEAAPGYLLMETQNNNATIRMAYRYDEAADTVTQTLEATRDGGETWRNVFTGVYRRREG